VKTWQFFLIRKERDDSGYFLLVFLLFPDFQAEKTDIAEIYNLSHHIENKQSLFLLRISILCQIKTPPSKEKEALGHIKFV
jgi:hypothetical protein